MNTEIEYETVIGLEVHAQLLTQSKLFCADRTSFGESPNSQVSEISLAYPGTLPSLNFRSIELAVKLGLAMNCDIERYNYFARKNYFYPDLPKGYQITQHTAPICKSGFLEITINGDSRKIRLNRIHLEEDAGKSLHDLIPNYTAIDLNRAGVALLEIVTEPDIRSSDEAFRFLTDLRKLVRWIGVCDGNMEEGSMRCDANISIRPSGSDMLGKRVEIKNLNSIRNVKRAIDVEVERLTALAKNGAAILQETRSYNADTNSSFSLRTKEEANDYRYFPEPDLPPFEISEKNISEIRAAMPALPHLLHNEFQEKFHLDKHDADLLTQDRETAEFYLALCTHCEDFKGAANWVTGPGQAYSNEKEIRISEFPLPLSQHAEIIKLIASGSVSFGNAAHILLPKLILEPERNVIELAKQLNLFQEKNNEALNIWIDEVLFSMPAKVTEYRKGKKGLLSLFAGQVKKISKGKADMEIVTKLLNEKLNA